MWRRDCAELYDLGLDKRMFAAPIQGLDARPPQPLIQAPLDTVLTAEEQYATVDGDRFLFLTPVDSPPRPISVVLNWPSVTTLQHRRPARRR